MRDDPSVIALVAQARAGHQHAWDGIIERFGSLVWSVIARYGLSGPDAEDVWANVWLRLLESLGSIRNPAALAGWLASTTRNECLQVLRAKQRHVQVDSDLIPEATAAALDELLMVHERHVALRTAFADLAERCRALLSLLFQDPPASYTDISADLGIPVGSIGPTRQRCLAALRAHPLVGALDERAADEPVR